MGKFSEEIRQSLRAGMVFLKVFKELERRGFVMMTFSEFKGWIDRRNDVPDNFIIFEKQISWTEQSLWFSSSWIREEARIALRLAGIEVLDEDDETLLMKGHPK